MGSSAPHPVPNPADMTYATAYSSTIDEPAPPPKPVAKKPVVKKGVSAVVKRKREVGPASSFHGCHSPICRSAALQRSEEVRASDTILILRRVGVVDVWTPLTPRAARDRRDHRYPPTRVPRW
jgi:hypothetical protein